MGLWGGVSSLMTVLGTGALWIRETISWHGRQCTCIEIRSTSPLPGALTDKNCRTGTMAHTPVTLLGSRGVPGRGPGGSGGAEGASHEMRLRKCWGECPL